MNCELPVMAAGRGAVVKARRRKVVVPGYVWCDGDGQVHEDVLDPWDYGDASADEREMHCKPEDHRPIYVMQAYPGEEME
jgi:hypothetical protein